MKLMMLHCTAKILQNCCSISQDKIVDNVVQEMNLYQCTISQIIIYTTRHVINVSHCKSLVPRVLQIVFAAKKDISSIVLYQILGSLPSFYHFEYLCPSFGSHMIFVKDLAEQDSTTRIILDHC